MTKPKSSIMDKVDFDLCHNVEDYNNNNGTTTVTPTTMNPRIRKYDDYSTEDPLNLDIPSKKPKTTTSTTTMGPPSHPLEHAYTNDPSLYHHSIRTCLPARLAAQYSIPRTSSINMSSYNNNTISRPTATATATMEEHDPPPSPSSTTTTTSPSSPQITDRRIPMIPVTLDGLPSGTSSAAATTGSLTPSRSAVFTIYEDPDETDPMDIDPLDSDWMSQEDDKENEDRLFYDDHRMGSGNGNGNGNENEDDDGEDNDDDTIEVERIRPMGSEAYTQQQSERALLSGAPDGLDNNQGNYYLSEDQGTSADEIGFYETLLLPWGSEYGSGGGGQRLHRRHSRRGLRWDEGSW